MQFKRISVPSRAVETIADNGAAQSQGMAGMETELVRATGLGNKFHQGALPTYFDPAPVTHAHLSSDRVVHLMRAIVRIQTKSQADFSFFPAHHSFQQGKILFFHPALGKLT